VTETRNNYSTDRTQYNLIERTTLSSDNAAFSEGPKEQLEVRLLEQALCRPLWVRGVCDDDIKGVLEILQVLEAIADVDLHLGVLEANGHAGEVLLGEADDSLHKPR
jgi:hypothetical protein